jgi:AcrR family transcriptional regulator
MISQRKKQIMTEATKIVNQKGLSALTMSLLAKNVGITEGAIYRHFSCKNDLIMEILNDIFLETTNQIIEIISQNLSNTEKLMKIMINQLSRFKKHPAQASFLFSEEYFLTNHEIKMLVYSIITTVQLYLQEIFEDGRLKGEFKSSIETRHTSMMFLGMVRMLVLNWKLSDYQWDLPTYGENHFHNFIKMIEQKNLHN